MKKTFITIVALLAVSSSVMAAGHVDSVRYLTTKFWQNWFVSADVNVDWWQGSDMNPAGDYTAVQWRKPSFGGSGNVGKWLTHSLGLRLSYDINGGKSYIGGLYPNRKLFNFLYDGEFVYDEDGRFVRYNGSDPDENGYYDTKFIYHNLHTDLLFSPIDFFQGYYNPDRIYTPVLYVGMGAACVSEKILINPSFINNVKYRKDESKQIGLNYEFSWDCGLINNFRLGDHFDVHLDLKWSIQRWNIDSWFYEVGGQGSDHGMTFNDDIRPKRADNNYSIGLGVTYYFSRIYELPNNCCDEMDSLQKKLDDFLNMPEPEPCDTVVKFVNLQTEDIISYPFSIFFNRDSYQLMSRRDLVNLREIANVAKENGYKLRLRGSCDSATATPAYNQTLSENRCRKIMMELMEMGIPESQIILVPMGGVKELDPTEYDRRVLIELIKEAQK